MTLLLSSAVEVGGAKLLTETDLPQKGRLSINAGAG